MNTSTRFWVISCFWREKKTNSQIDRKQAFLYLWLLEFLCLMSRITFPSLALLTAHPSLPLLFLLQSSILSIKQYLAHPSSTRGSHYLMRSWRSFMYPFNSSKYCPLNKALLTRTLPWYFILVSSIPLIVFREQYSVNRQSFCSIDEGNARDLI